MHYGELKKCDIANGIGVRVTLFVSGCTNRCPDCFQPQTWDFDYGKEFTEDTKAEIFAELDKPFVNGLTVLGGEPFEPRNQRELLPLLRQLDQQAASSDMQLLQTKLLYLRCLFDFLDVLSEARPSDTLSGKKRADTTALRIKSYLDVNFRTPFSAQDLCAQFFLSQRQLDRIFCRAYGMTVHAYLTELRRHYACALLEKGEFSARRAALESGFSGYQQMRRAVRRKQP